MRLRFLAIALLSAACTASHAADDPLEYRVKAAFVFNFARFVTWPASRFATPDAPVEICVLGSQGFSEVLEETVAGKTVGARSLHVKRVEQSRELIECHVAYVMTDTSAQTERLLSQVAGHSVLTVYEASIALEGGVVRFYLEDRRVRFEINAAEAEREKLQVSSKLLAVAKVVDE
ncbi:MAG TPA: YfiR family protein [Nevskiaceae bacterium]|nr:YfiR family protein [Nevskiaceae bacterium]